MKKMVNLFNILMLVFLTLSPAASPVLASANPAPTRAATSPNLVVSNTLAAAQTPSSIWDPTVVPSVASENDPNAIEVGVKFRAETAGYITSIRFYKGTNNTGTHLGNLWTNTGQLLATATFANETASGWQQVDFATPVLINANTTYVASYHTDVGYYSVDGGYFSASGIDLPPLHALEDGIDGGNGVYQYGTSGFPNNSYNASNYWVDVVFASDTALNVPVVTQVFPTQGAFGVSTSANLTATFNKDMDPNTIDSTTFELRDGANNLVTGTFSYDAATFTATLDPVNTLANGSFTATIRGGTTDPRVKDIDGNALSQDYVWTFSTSTCDSILNPIVCENTKPGNPSSEWDISGSGDPSIQGFATDISVDQGQTVHFKIDTNASGYRLDIYRMGYYAGLGARKVASVLPTASLPQNQPACLTDDTTGLMDCGNWAELSLLDRSCGCHFRHLLRQSHPGGQWWGQPYRFRRSR